MNMNVQVRKPFFGRNERRAPRAACDVIETLRHLGAAVRVRGLISRRGYVPDAAAESARAGKGRGRRNCALAQAAHHAINQPSNAHPRLVAQCGTGIRSIFFAGRVLCLIHRTKFRHLRTSIIR